MAAVGGDEPAKKRGQASNLSPSLIRALSHIKDFMTDNQKAQILLREGKIEMDRGKMMGAVEVFSHGVSFNPMLTSFYLLRASCYKAIDMWMEAYFDCSYAIRLEPDCGSHFCARSLILSKLKRIVLAIEDADSAVEVTILASAK